MKKLILVIKLFVRFVAVGHCQNIQHEKTLWTFIANKTEKGFGNYQEVLLSKIEINELYYSKETTFALSLKDENNNDMIADMELQNMSDAKVKCNNKAYTNDVFMPKIYKGVVRGLTTKHNVMLTIAPGFISMQALLSKESIMLEKATNANEDTYILYNSRDLKFPSKPFDCGTPPPTSEDVERLQKMQRNYSNKMANPTDKCIFVFVDCTEALYNHYGSVQNTVNNIYSIWNNVRTAYNNEQLNVGISEINVWTTTTPYNTSNRTVGIQSFAAYYQNNYYGNMAMVLDWTLFLNGNAAVAGGYGWAKGIAPNVCGNYNPNPTPPFNHGSFIYGDLNYMGNYQNFPVPARSQEVYLIIHEVGHLLGSYHTHNCGWLLSTNPNVYGAIDNCAFTEGGCSAGASPVNGGTFMSYCIFPNQFVNFNNGFGPLPGQAIRAFVDGNDCLTNCVGCFSSISLGAIPFQGVYQYEVTNQITANGVINGNSATTVKIDAGVKVLLVNGFKATQGSKVKIFIDGCGGVR